MVADGIAHGEDDLRICGVKCNALGAGKMSCTGKHPPAHDNPYPFLHMPILWILKKSVDKGD
jgi:hypothetical protein